MKKIFSAILLSLCTLAFSHSAVAASDKGSAEEAIALVKKAAAYIKANGKEKAFAEFNKPDGSFKDRDLYIFAMDMSGVMNAHGVNPKLIGKSLAGLKDVDDKQFIKSFIDVANSKGKAMSQLPVESVFLSREQHAGTCREECCCRNAPASGAIPDSFQDKRSQRHESAAAIA